MTTTSISALRNPHNRGNRGDSVKRGIQLLTPGARDQYWETPQALGAADYLNLTK